MCVDGTCRPGTSPCAFDEVCDEAGRRCVYCAGSSDPVCLRDAGMPDAPTWSCAESVPGTACSVPGDCPVPSECQPEPATDFAGTIQRDGSPGRPLPLRSFPGGYCAVSCEAGRLNDTCGSCAACSGDVLAGRTRVPLRTAGVCRERCTVSPTGTGCPRPGYACDAETGTCMEACFDDVQCQIVQQDLDGDGNPELVDLGTSYPGFCDRTTGRCRTRGAPGARIGDRCTEDFDCPDDGACIRPPGSPNGVCGQLGCRAPGATCPPGSACDVHNAGAESACLLPCPVGAEDGTAAMRGSTTGGSPSCGLGLSCVWNGVEPATSPSGSCVVGQYNDRTGHSVGAPCQSAADCDSPFGYGACLFSTLRVIDSGLCTVDNCASFPDGSGGTASGLLPRVPIGTPICDPALREVCVNLGPRGEAAQTRCLVTCTDASACAPGYACSDLFGSAAHFCWPTCNDSTECRLGATCESAPGAACTPTDAFCLCSDRMPR